MASTANPARLDDYRARLADLVEAKTAHQDLNNDHHVKNLNRQIQAQLKWIAKAEAAVG
jgi:hypothetical protein